MILSILEFEGDPDELVERHRQTTGPVGARLAKQFGGISSTVVRTDNGIMVVNLWENEEGRHQMPEHPDMIEAREKGGFPPPHAKAYQVVDHRSAAD
ncbi:MAG: hypothetical protein ACXVYV_02015 [Gaiellales bacterium]